MNLVQGVFSYGNRKAIVTGGTSGIGAETAIELAECGCSVVIVGRNKERASQIVKKAANNGLSVEYILADISRASECERVAREANKMLGGLDILVNCAGILSKSTIEDITEDEWDSLIKTNLNSCFFLSQKCLPYLREGNNSRIINISSNAGRMGGYENSQSYTASKGGIISITMGMARQLAADGITVNVVCPGTTVTDMGKMYDKETIDRLTSRIPMARLGTTRDTAAAVCYFASIEAGFVTGAILDVNGGMYMG